MNPPTIEITKEGRVWSWLITRNGEVLAGGYGRTKADAQNDAAIAARRFQP